MVEFYRTPDGEIIIVTDKQTHRWSLNSTLIGDLDNPLLPLEKQTWEGGAIHLHGNGRHAVSLHSRGSLADLANCQPMQLVEEQPVGLCPVCGKPVFNSQEPQGPVYKCPRDLPKDHPLWLASNITEAQMQEKGIYSNCYLDFYGHCVDHLPMHSACYDNS